MAEKIASHSASTSRVASWPVLALAVALVVLFSPLLLSPSSLPIASLESSREAGLDAITWTQPLADLAAQQASFESTGRPGFFAADSHGRNRLVESPSFFTQPLLFVLDGFLPMGIALTLIDFASLLLGAWGVSRLALRVQLSVFPAFTAAVFFLLTGPLLDAVSSTRLIFVGQSAALFPFCVLLAIRFLESPGIWLAIGLASACGWMLCAGSVAFGLAALVLGAALVAAFHGRKAPGDTSRLTRYAGLAAALAWGIFAAAYRWLPDLLGGELSTRVFTPWWAATEGGLRLPFFLGVVGLAGIAFGLRVAFVCYGRGATLWLAGSLVGVFALAPITALPLASCSIALVAGAAFMTPVLLRNPGLQRFVAATALVALVVEALPEQSPLLDGVDATRFEVASPCVEFLGMHAAGETVALRGKVSPRTLVSLARRHVRVLPVPADETIDAQLDAKFLVTRSPQRTSSLQFVQAFRQERVFIYRNAGWRGHALLLDEGGTDATAHVLRSSRAVDEWRIDVDSTESTLLALRAPYLRGFEARIGGEPVPVQHAGGRPAIRIPAGRSEVVFAFAPPGLELGMLLSALAALAAPIVVALSFFRTRPRRLEYTRTVRETAVTDRARHVRRERPEPELPPRSTRRELTPSPASARKSAALVSPSVERSRDVAREAAGVREES